MYVHGNFADMQRIADENRIGTVDGILLDLGISSDQLDSPARGFSFMHEGPLDMRMDQGHTPSAEQMINSLPEESLAELLRNSGEEPAARRIARAIVTARQVSPIRTTGELAEIVARATGGRRGRLHPATRTFQAIRIGVNDELENLDRALPAALALLKPGGRLVIISFHSLEDRKVKQFIAGHAGRWVACQAGGRTWEGVEPSVTNLTKKPVIAGDAEVEANPRARSAKLRAAERNR
jgi:16S rRNA (cytosine1402-N4)-methyltransferase